MTEEQLKTANEYIEYHQKQYGYAKSNTEFVFGYIERLQEAGLQDNTFDIIISNCVVNLSPDKRAVISEAYRVLKEGGELYFSDVYADKDLPESIRSHKVLWGECIAGALSWEQLYDLAADIGFSVPRLVTASPIELSRPELREVTEGYNFLSVTYRLFKLPHGGVTHPGCKVMYDGNMTGFPDRFQFDDATCFKTTFVAASVSVRLQTNEETGVSPELATILQTSRFKDEFTFRADPCCAQGCIKEQMRVNPFSTPMKSESTVSAACCPANAPAAACCPSAGKKCC